MRGNLVARLSLNLRSNTRVIIRVELAPPPENFRSRTPLNLSDPKNTADSFVVKQWAEYWKFQRKKLSRAKQQ